MTQLKRSLSWYHAAAVTVGAVLGSGVLILPALTAQVAGPLAIFAWIIMSALSFPIAFIFSRLAAKIPHAGGILAYIGSAFGTPISRATGWLFVCMYPIGVPVVALIGANYLGSVIELSRWGIILVAGGIMTIAIVLNIRGIELAGWLQLIISCAIIGVLVLAVSAATPHIRVANFHPFAPHGWMALGTATVLTFWCFVGWETAANLSEEFKRPLRDISIGLGVAVIFISILYFALAFSTIGTRSYGNQLGLAPLSILIEDGFGHLATVLTTVLALFITLSTVHTNTASFSRMLYAQARDGHLPVVLARVHAKFQTPTIALYLMSFLCAITIFCYGVFEVNLNFFVKLVSVSDISVYMLCMAAAFTILPGSLNRWIAGICLTACAVIYVFSGWMIVIPPLLIFSMWVLSKRFVKGTATAANRHV